MNPFQTVCFPTTNMKPQLTQAISSAQLFPLWSDFVLWFADGITCFKDSIFTQLWPIKAGKSIEKPKCFQRFQDGVTVTFSKYVLRLFPFLINSLADAVVAIADQRHMC